MKTQPKLGNLAVIMMLGILPVSRCVATGFVWDDFESYTVGASLTGLVHRGWGASSPQVVVTNNVFSNPTNMAVLPLFTVASNAVGGQAGTIWTDCLLNEAIRVDPSNPPPVNPLVSVMIGVSTNGYAIVYNPASNGWDVCSHDVVGNALTGLASGSWARVTLCQDYANHRSAVFLNGRLLRQGLPFISNRNDYATFRLTCGADSPAYMDDVYVSNAIPPSLLNLPLSTTNDVDGDGVADVREIQDYGSLAGWGPVISNSVTLSVPDVTLSNNLTVTNGATLTVLVTSLTVTGTVRVAGASTIAITNGTVSFANLVIGAGSYVRVVNATLSANGWSVSGTFTLDANGNTQLVPSSLNYTNDFESYSVGASLGMCGGQGWGASGAGSEITANIGGNATRLAMVAAVSGLSNVVSATTGQSNVWTDVTVRDDSTRYIGAAYPPVNTSRAVAMFINTNNHLMIWNNHAWDECSQDAFGQEAPTIATGQWVRICVCEDFAGQKAAVFVNGKMLRQQVPFISATVDRYGLLNLNAGDGAAYLDNVRIWTTVPPALTDDGDGDGVADALEIQRSGNTMAWPHGSVFKLR